MGYPSRMLLAVGLLLVGAAVLYVGAEAAVRGGTGNLFGTLAAFTTGVLGLAALVRPLVIDAAGSAAFLAMAVLYAVVATTFVAYGRAGRVLGAFVLASYGAWLYWSATV